MLLFRGWIEYEAYKREGVVREKEEILGWFFGERV